MTFQNHKDTSPINKLTEFPPLEPDDRSDGSKFSISKLLWWRKTDPKVDLDTCSLTSSISDNALNVAGVAAISTPVNEERTASSPAHGKSSGPSSHESKGSVGGPGPGRLSVNVNRATSLYRSDSTLSNRSNPCPPSPEIGEPGSASPFEARTLPNVLRRISSLIAMGSNNQSDIKKYWMPDSVSKECYDCAERFTTFRRKHHCRICGQIFCSRCCNQEIPGKIIGYSGDLRVCTYCCKIVLSYLQSADLSTDLNDELRLVQEDLQSRFGGAGADSVASLSSVQRSQPYGSPAPDEHLTAYRSLPRRRASLVYQEERFIAGRSGSVSSAVVDGSAFDLLQGTAEEFSKQKPFGDWVSLKALWDDMCHPVSGIDWTTHRHNMMKNYTHCVVGSELVDWLLAQRKILWRGQGVQIGQMLVDVNLIECVSQIDQIFLDAYALYRPVTFPLASVQEELSGERSSVSTRSSTDMGGQDPHWLKQITHSLTASGPRSNDVEDEILFAAEDTPTSEGSLKIRLPSANSLYSLDLNTSEAKVTLSKPKEKEGSKAIKDPYCNTDSTKDGTKVHQKKVSIGGGGGSSTTETMTDEFLQKTFLSQKGRQQSDQFIPSTVSSTSWHTPQQLTSDNEVIAFQRLCNAFIRHENDFVLQLLEKMKLSNHWIDIILPIVHKVTEIVRPDVRYSDDDMDIRQYIHFKKVPGGKREDCRIVNGVVCTKNVAHRDMRQKRKGAKILLIGSSIDYQRFENRFLSLEPLVMQEHDYLKNTIARIVSAGPDIVLVEKTVSRLAQEFLLDAGLTLVLNTKGSVMERVARLTQGVIESSADSPIGKPQLGLCHNFYLETFKVQLTGGGRGKKTLMFFDGCAMHLGCTVLLRGASERELKKVKQVVSFLMFVAYNWRLERSLHTDLFSMAPEISGVESPTGNRATSDTKQDNKKPREPSDDVFATPPFSTSVAHSTVVDGECASPIAIDRINETSQRTSTPTSSLVPIEPAVTKAEACDDMTDPLHSYLVSTDKPVADHAMNNTTMNSITNENDSEDTLIEALNTPIAARSAFEKELQKCILSASPFIGYALPYLETEEGRNCKLRKYFPKVIYRSSRTYDDFQSGKENKLGNNCMPETPNVQWKPAHPFTSQNITGPLTSDHIQSLLADFRRKGNRLDFDSHTIPTPVGLEEEEDSGRDRCMTATLMESEDTTTEQVDANGVKGGVLDALDPFKHQRLAVLFCSFSRISTNMPNFCVNPWVVNMDFYGRNDISLGMFLERYCFRKTYLCPARQCDTPMLHHLRRFVHEQGCVTIALKELDKPIAGSGENILMWNGCAACKTVCPIVPMSVDAWSLSFAKYLELRFHGHRYTRRAIDDEIQKLCDHSLHHDFVHYFAQENILSSFSFSTMKIWEISLPVLYIRLKKDPKSVPSLIDDIKVVAITGHGVYSNILEALCSLRDSCSGLRVEEVIITLLEHLKAERAVFRSKIEDIQLNLTSAKTESASERNELDAFLWKVTDSIGFLKSSISETIFSWNTRFGDLFLLRKKEEKQNKIVSQQIKVDDDNAPRTYSRLESSDSPQSSSTSPPIRTGQPANLINKSSDETGLSPANEGALCSSTESRTKERDRASQASGSTLDISISGVLEELSKTPLPASHLLPPKTSNEVLLNVADIASSVNNIKPSDALTHERNKSTEIPTEKLFKTLSDNSVGAGDDSLDSRDKKSGGVTMKNLISHFMSNTASGQVVQSPWLPIEHHFQASLTTIPVTVFENEPSSIVAFALSSNEYNTKRQEYLKHKMSQQSVSGVLVPEEDTNGKKSNKMETIANDTVATNSAGTGVNADDIAIDSDQQEKTTGHIEVQFNSGSTKFYCRVYFGEKFRQLRKTCILDGEEFYIRSIARCISWAASGGKSGSTFCKTIDDRFVIKQMNKFEIQSFLDFAPKYFNYMRSCYQEDKPTVLAKIVGVYRIGFKNSVSNTASKLDILIMENLFYERNISQKFDLKGSIRNRLATTSGKVQEDLVLLDENLVNMSCENPLYVRPHTKTILSVALTNDSKFLKEQTVMDYSLLVGLDESTNELVVGIIDYIRTFTWDKKMETLIKSIGSQGKAPTVVSPEEYQTRFCGAMDRYFLIVPDRWMGLGLGVD